MYYSETEFRVNELTNDIEIKDDQTYFLLHLNTNKDKGCHQDQI